jgi:hypothetical protein
MERRQDDERPRGRRQPALPHGDLEVFWARSLRGCSTPEAVFQRGDALARGRALANPIERISFVRADNLESTMMALADFALDVAALAVIGRGRFVISAIAASHSMARGGAAELPAETRFDECWQTVSGPGGRHRVGRP